MKAVRESGAVPGSEYLLEVDDVRKEFPGVVALDNVKFKLRRGSVHALMGENGAGKSTLMKIVAGIYTPDSGSFKLRGVDATQEALAAMKAGDLDVTVFQDAAGQGKGAVDTAIKLVKGEKVDAKVYIPFQLVTPANMADYMSKN